MDHSPQLGEQGFIVLLFKMFFLKAFLTTLIENSALS